MKMRRLFCIKCHGNNQRSHTVLAHLQHKLSHLMTVQQGDWRNHVDPHTALHSFESSIKQLLSSLS